MSKTKAHDGKTICGAKTRAGTPCKQLAGWGTDHVGEGRCKLHGGKSTGPKDKVKAATSQKKNKNAEKHGLFSKYLPSEANEIIDSIESINRIDLLWENIKIQAAAIIRSQKIMYVRDREDKDENVIERIEGDLEIEKYQVETAGQRQASYLDSQSRAMTTLTRMIKEYEELCNRNDLVTEEQKLRVDKLKQELGNTDKEPIEIRLVAKDENNGS